MFGGDGEDRADPQEVEVIWPGYDDGYDDYGYVTMGHFDPLPKIPEQSYGSFWYPGAVLLSDTMVMTYGGGYPATILTSVLVSIWCLEPGQPFPR